MAVGSAVSPNLLVLGGGMRPDGLPSGGTLARAITAGEYFRDHPSIVERIVCSGAWSASMDAPPRGFTTEAESVATVLRSLNVPEDVIVTDPTPRTSFESIRSVAERGLFDGRDIRATYPLGIVTVPSHYRRVKPIARKAFGLGFLEVQNIRVDEQLSTAFRVAQGVGAVVTRASLIGVSEGDLEGLDRAHRRFARMLHRPM